MCLHTCCWLNCSVGFELMFLGFYGCQKYRHEDKKFLYFEEENERSPLPFVI